MFVHRDAQASFKHRPYSQENSVQRLSQVQPCVAGLAKRDEKRGALTADDGARIYATRNSGSLIGWATSSGEATLAIRSQTTVYTSLVLHHTLTQWHRQGWHLRWRGPDHVQHSLQFDNSCSRPQRAPPSFPRPFDDPPQQRGRHHKTSGYQSQRDGTRTNKLFGTEQETTFSFLKC